MEDNNHNFLYIIFIVVLLFVASLFITWHWFTEPKVYETAKMYNHYVAFPDSMIMDKKITKDSIPLEKYLTHIDSISRVTIQKADNYISDVDLMISKSSAWMGMWLGIFAIIMTVPTIIQFTMTYRNEHRIETMLTNSNKEVKALESELKCSIKEHRISSIMMCMSSIPDPQLTPSQDEKRMFVDHFISFLAKEFEDYIGQLEIYFNLSGRSATMDDNIGHNNLLMVITMLKSSLIRTQCVFSDITQNVQYRLLQDELDKVFKRIEKGELWGAALIASLRTIRKKFDILIASIEAK